MRRITGCFIATLAFLVLDARPAAAHMSGGESALLLIPTTALVPVPHFEFGSRPAMMLAWPMRPVSFFTRESKSDKGGGFEFWLTPSVEPQYSFAGAGRLLLVGQASVAYADPKQGGIALSLEGGGVLGTDGSGWMAGIECSHTTSGNDGFLASWGLVARRTQTGSSSRFDLGLDFHLGISSKL